MTTRNELLMASAIHENWCQQEYHGQGKNFIMTRCIFCGAMSHTNGIYASVGPEYKAAKHDLEHHDDCAWSVAQEVILG